jgi:hypothetical protein
MLGASDESTHFTDTLKPYPCLVLVLPLSSSLLLLLLVQA